MKKLLVALCFASFASLASATPSVLASVCNVAAGASASVVQAAVNSCSTVALASGTYAWNAHVDITKPNVTVDGAGVSSTLIVQHARVNIFQITAPGTTIENLSVDTGTYNPGVPPVLKNPVPGTIFSAQSNTHIINVASKAGTGFGIRITGPNPCDTYKTTGTVVSNVSSTNTGKGGFTALDIDCSNGAQLSNVTINGDYIAFYQDENVTLNGENYTAGPYEQGSCGADWYVTGPANNIAISNVITHNGKGIAKGTVTHLTVTNERFAPGDTCTKGLSSVAPSSTPHVLLIMLENKGYQATLGSCGADPYFCSLASKYATATDWYGTAHPSLPNYLAITSGSTQGCTSDNCKQSKYKNDLMQQLGTAGIPYALYMESMPKPCDTSDAKPYVHHHNPGTYFTDDNCKTTDVAYPGSSKIASALDGTGAPDFVWITPNIKNDMHSGTVQAGDAWLQSNVGAILNSTWFTGGNATVIVTMDENDAQPKPNGGQVPMVVISSNATGIGSVATGGDHYGTLRSIEEVFGLPLLGAASNSSNGDLSSLFG